VATQGLRSGEVIDVVLYCWELPNFRWDSQGNKQYCSGLEVYWNVKIVCDILYVMFMCLSCSLWEAVLSKYQYICP
jgi:hypothetical protein